MTSVKTKTLVLILFALCGFATDAVAARVDNLYAAVVPLESGSRALPNAFDVALGQVLVKVTGRRNVGMDEAVIARFGDASTLVQQYRIDSDNQVWVRFDDVALRRELDALGESVWGSERPSTLVWLVIDDGVGERQILTGVPDEPSTTGMAVPGGDPNDLRTDLIREELIAAADARGLPLMLPSIDTLEVDSISPGDVWGGFTEPLVEASAPYGSDAILVGRARSSAIEALSVRWTLLLDDERFDWDGNIASGPDDVADFFAARLATSVGSSSKIVLTVDAVDSLEAYGRLSAYLSDLDLVEELAVDRVSGDRVVYRLKVRGDADQLMRSIALQRVLQPVDDSLEWPSGVPGGAQTLRYRLMAGPQGAAR